MFIICANKQFADIIQIETKNLVKKMLHKNKKIVPSLSTQFLHSPLERCIKNH